MDRKVWVWRQMEGLIMSDRYQLHKSGHMDPAVHCTKMDIEERMVMQKIRKRTMAQGLVMQFKITTTVTGTNSNEQHSAATANTAEHRGRPHCQIRDGTERLWAMDPVEI